MGFRLYDTKRINHQAHRSMSLEARAVLQYLEANCDYAGIWEIDLAHLEFWAGREFSLTELRHMFGERIHIFGDNRYLLLREFFDQQYGNRKDSWNAKRTAEARLHSLGVYSQVTVPPQSPDSQGTLHVSVSVDVKEGGVGETTPSQAFDFEIPYRDYPRKGQGKQEAFRRLPDIITTPEAYADFHAAVKRYAAEVRAAKTESKYIKLFSSFVGTKNGSQPWRDFIEATKPAPKVLQLEDLE
jgi:hypothetical protein